MGFETLLGCLLLAAPFLAALLIALTMIFPNVFSALSEKFFGEEDD